MGNVAVVGSQWGDEGKGKIVDWLSERADVVVRFQGGHNAGHTLVVNGKVYKLSLLPSGVVRGKLSIIGNGVVVDPWALMDEIKTVREQGLSINPDTLKIAENACLILPLHGLLDRARETARGQRKIGTTGRGIGPAYEDKIARRAIRVCDLRDKSTLVGRVKDLVSHHNAMLRGLKIEEIDVLQTVESLEQISEELLSYTAPVWRVLEDVHKKSKRILFEGAQGFMLDIDHGTYPYVTSSNTLSGQAAAGSGIAANAIDYVLGITKSYTTRVGSGPFPTEQPNEIGELLGERGFEFGTVTGRQRRCGWFDAVLVRQSATIGGIAGIALTKLDVLDGFKEIKICVGYKYGDTTFDYLPADIKTQSSVQPVYEVLEGWEQNTRGVRTLSELPIAAINYMKRIEELIKVPVALLSTSPERLDTITIEDPFNR